jgi:hypothetical protein
MEPIPAGYPDLKCATPPPINRKVALVRIAVLLVCGAAVFGALEHLRADAAGTTEITAADRARSLRFDARVSPADQAWILAAERAARPEAARLLDEIDGMTTIGTFSLPRAGMVGFARPTGRRTYEVQFNLAYLDGRRKADRTQAVLHELGHVIDFAILPDAERDRLAAQVPSSGVCFEATYGDCAPAAEQFADTFAKWALRGAVSSVGAGYGLMTPASLEDWGTPLAALAVKLDVDARD